jgi:hypothetical protein
MLRPSASWSADLDATDLIRRLAKPAPATIEFVEVRFSPLLKEPVKVAGQLGYEGPTSLDRRVEAPYRETTEIRGESVRVQREGEPVRSFALKRAPELRALLGSFAALLAGDPTAVGKSFTIAAQGDDKRWHLSLQPIDAQTRKRLKSIDVAGAGTTPRCFSLASGDGATSYMLLGDASHAKLPEPLARQWFEQQCADAAS